MVSRLLYILRQGDLGMAILVSRYPSQTEWSPYGHLICTPVCLLVAAACLHMKESHQEKADTEPSSKKRKKMVTRVKDLTTIHLSADYVRDVMNLSHALYRDHFAHMGLPLKIEELYQFIPSRMFQYVEATGMIWEEAQTESVHVDNMLVMPLIHILLYLAQKAQDHQKKQTLITTADEHTICYLFNENGEIYVFDPLPASMSSLPCEKQALLNWLKTKYPGKQTMYSALVMVCKEEMP